jgi:hypothetical protein
MSWKRKCEQKAATKVTQLYFNTSNDTDPNAFPRSV